MLELNVTKGAIIGAKEEICPKSHGVIALGKTVELHCGRIHEVSGDASDMFAVLTASKMSGPIVWIGLRRDVSSLAPTALQQFVDPSRLVLTEVSSRQEGLWACEQALRSKGANCVVCELDVGPNLKESRRLQISAEQSGSVGLILFNGHAQTSACQTRWQCHALCDDDASWTWKLTKNKSGNLGAWRVRIGEQENAPGTFHMAATTSA